MQPYYFTFGVGHLLAGHFIKLIGTIDSTRARIDEQFGKTWGFQYTEEEWTVPYNQQERWGLTEIVVNDPVGFEAAA